MVESNEIAKKDFDTDTDIVPLEERKEISNELVEENSYEFHDLKEKNNPDNLIYEYKTEGRIGKDFSNY